MTGHDPRSTFDPSRPLLPGEALRRIREIRESGMPYALTEHAVQELERRDMTMLDVTNVLRRGGHVDPPEPHPKTGNWMYRVHTDLMCVVVEFREGPRLGIITGWRKGSST
jgi:hypothetical protein